MFQYLLSLFHAFALLFCHLCQSVPFLSPTALQYHIETQHRGDHDPPTRNYCLIVENLSSQTTWQDLKNYMSQIGEVKYAHKTRSSEGCVAFASEKVNSMVIIN